MLGWFAFILILSASILVTLILGIKSRCLPQTVVALILQVLLSVIFLVVWGLQGDATTYHEAAKTLLESWSNGGDPIYTLPAGKQSTVWIAAQLYDLVGSLPIAYLIFFASFTAMFPAFAAITTRLFDLPNASQLAAWLGVFAPPFIIWAPWMRRESFAFGLIGVALMTFGLFYNSKWKVGLVLWLSAAYLMSVTRPQLLLILAAGTITVIILKMRQPAHSKFSSWAQTSTAVLLVIGSGGLIWWTLTSTGTSTVIQSENRDAIVREISAPSQGLGVTREVGYAEKVINSMIGPLPWDWKSFSWMVAGLDGILMLTVWALLVFGFVRKPEARRMTIVLVAASLPLIAGEAYIHGNYGITMRVRAHYLLILLPAIAVALTTLASQPRTRKFLDRMLRATRTSSADDPVINNNQ